MNTKRKVHDRHTKASQKKISLKKVVLALLLLILTLTPLVIYIVSATKEQPKPEEKYFPISEEAEYAPDELIVKFSKGYEPDKLNIKVRERELSRESMVGQAVIQRDNVAYLLTAQKTPEERKEIVEQMFEDLDVVGYEKVSAVEDGVMARYYTLMFPQGSDLNKKQEQLAQYEAIDFTEPNHVVEVFQSSIPNDTRFSEMWAFEMINALEAWKTTTGDRSITVAVIDSGVDYNHADIADNITSNGTDIANSDNDPMDTLGHGTHVSGIVGAVGNNNEGIAGTNWEISIMPIKVTNGKNTFSDIIEDGIEYAVSMNVDVINLSIGTEKPAPCAQSEFWQDATQNIIENNITVIAAAGNHGDSAENYSPGSCPGVITVGSVDRDENRSTFSNYGSVVDIAAPGGIDGSITWTAENSILSTHLNNSYESTSGTSQAAPYVTGTAALLLSMDDSLTPEQIRECLVEGADTITTDLPIGPRLNIAGALAACGFTDGTQSKPGGQSLEFYVEGVVYLDSNENNSRDTGEPGVPRASLVLTGPRTYTMQADSNGNFKSPNIEPGQYDLALIANGDEVFTTSFTISQTIPIRSSIEIPASPGVLDDDSSDLPSIPAGIPGEIIFPEREESDATPTNTPTPTPFVFYDCEEVTENATRNGRQIQISHLECTPS